MELMGLTRHWICPCLTYIFQCLESKKSLDTSIVEYLNSHILKPCYDDYYYYHCSVEHSAQFYHWSFLVDDVALLPFNDNLSGKARTWIFLTSPVANLWKISNPMNKTWVENELFKKSCRIWGYFVGITGQIVPPHRDSLSPTRTSFLSQGSPNFWSSWPLPTIFSFSSTLKKFRSKH